MQPLTSPQDFIEMALRRKWWVIIPFVLVIMASVGVYRELPKIYRASTLILVQPQKIPQSYVQSTVTLSVADRLATIRQQILSRTSLETVIRELNLIRNPSDPLSINQKVGSMRRAILIDVHYGSRGATSAFTISFEDQNPTEASRIVNKIASLFIRENLKIREEQARGTSKFLERELLAVENKLNEKEEEIRKFKERHMGELPGQLDANLRILERLQQEFGTNNDTLLAARRRKANLEDQIDQIRRTGSYVSNGQGTVTQDPLMAQLSNERRRLQELETQYTHKHPDVITAKATIRKLEAQLMERAEKVTDTAPKINLANDPTLKRLNAELREVVDQIGRLERDQVELKTQVEAYHRKVENAPRREEQMSTLLRDYGLQQNNYRSLLDKKIQAQLAENLEKRQESEQFKILDPATPPAYPYKPDKKKVFGLAFLLGIGLGGGLAFLREQMDRSFRKAEDVEEFLGIPVIASIPRIENKKRVKRAA